jgi:hypothetical protein
VTPRLAAVATALLAVLLLPTGAGSQLGCENQLVEVGIVHAKGCFTSAAGPGGATIYTTSEPGTEVDLNGFLVWLGEGDSLTINNKTNEVSTGGRKVQLLSRNWPIQGRADPLGDPLPISFVAPASGELLLEDIRLGTNNAWVNALAGLSPVGTVDTPVKLLEGGKGSMDLTVALTGVFSLKDKDQTAVIRLPTEVGKGTILDGFHVQLKEIDGFRAVVLKDLDAEYSAAEKTLAGSATAVFPFTVTGDVGFGVGFRFENGTIDEFDAKVSGLRIPIGSPPGGFITDIGGGFRRAVVDSCGQELNISANIKAIFGPQIPTPWGKVEPIGADAGLQLGSDSACALFFKLTGGVEIFRLPVADVLLEMHSNGLIKFGAGLGIGFPSYRNSPDDPFYIGARVDGWVAKQKFQFSGEGRVRLFGLDIFDGSILVNDRAAGACWTVVFVKGGAVYEYGAPAVKTFGIGCGLDVYREQFAGLSAGRSGLVAANPPRQRPNRARGDRRWWAAALHRYLLGRPGLPLPRTDRTAVREGGRPPRLRQRRHEQDRHVHPTSAGDLDDHAATGLGPDREPEGRPPAASRAGDGQRHRSRPGPHPALALARAGPHPADLRRVHAGRTPRSDPGYR